MRKYYFNWLPLVLVTFLLSCNSNGLKGKKYYLLTTGTSEYVTQLKEMELNFISNDKVETKMLLYANDFGYKTISDTSEESESKIYSYKYENGIFEMPDFKVLAKLDFLSDGRIRTNEREYFYPTSIIPLLGTEVADERVDESAKSKTLARIYKEILKKPLKPLLKMKNGMIILNKDNSGINISEKDTLSKQYNNIVSKIQDELGESPKLMGDLGEKYAEVEKIRKRVREKLNDSNIIELRDLLNQLDYKSKEMLSDIKKLKDENKRLSDYNN